MSGFGCRPFEGIEPSIISASDCLCLLKSGRFPTTKHGNIPQPEGRQAKSDTHRTDYEGPAGPAEIQWQPGISPDSVRLDKAGSGASPAAFWLLCRRGQSNPCRSTEYPEQPERPKKRHSEELSSENHPRRRREPAKKKGAGGQTVSSLRTSLLTSLLAHTAQRSVMGRGPPVRVDIWPPASVMMRLPAA